MSFGESVASHLCQLKLTCAIYADVIALLRPKDLIRLHALNLTEYDAVLYVDTDVQIVGDIQPLLRCAASGEFMMTEGSGAPMNAGFMVRNTNPPAI